MSDERLVYENMRTPWGAAQTVKVLIDGIGQVHTAGHGGFKLSHERNLKVPLYMRQTSGWYEVSRLTWSGIRKSRTSRRRRHDYPGCPLFCWQRPVHAHQFQG